MRVPKLERPWKKSSEIESCDLEFHNETGQYTGWHNGCCSWWHIPPRLFTDFDGSGVRLLAILRDPIERVISEVRWEDSLKPQQHGVAAAAAADALSNETLSSRIGESVMQRLSEDPTVH